MTGEHQAPTPEEWAALKREADSRDWELQAQIARLEEEAGEARFQAKLAEVDKYDEVAREKLKLERVLDKLARFESQQKEFSNLVQTQYWIAEQAGIDPSQLDPSQGVQGMVSEAFAKKGAAPPVLPSPVSPPAPQAPSPSPSGDVMNLDPAERRRRISKLKGKGFADLMESLGEKK